MRKANFLFWLIVGTSVGTALGVAFDLLLLQENKKN